MLYYNIYESRQKAGDNKLKLLRFALISLILGVLFTKVAIADIPKVVVDIAPTYSLVAQVMKGIGQPNLLVKLGASPHEHAMRPSDAKSLESANLIFWVSRYLTPWLDNVMPALVKNAEVVELLKTKNTTVLPYRKGATFDLQSFEHGNDEGHENHNHEGIDPHGWLSPKNSIGWLYIIAEKLSDIDPNNAESYLENADRGRIKIEKAISETEVLLKQFRDTRFVVFHDAYQYFEDYFKVLATGAVSMSDASAPGPARISEIRKTIDELNVTCVFSEPQFNPALLDSAIGGTNAKAAIIDPLGSQLLLDADFYPKLLKTIGESIASCSP